MRTLNWRWPTTFFVLAMAVIMSASITMPSCSKKDGGDVSSSQKTSQEKSVWQTLHHTTGLDDPVYIPGNYFFSWQEKNPAGVILFRFAKTKQDLKEESWQRLEGEYVRLSPDLASGGHYIDFRLPEEIGRDDFIKISSFPK